MVSRLYRGRPGASATPDDWGVTQRAQGITAAGTFWASTGAALAGVLAGRRGIFSCFGTLGAVGASQDIIANSGGRLQIGFKSTNEFFVLGRRSPDGVAVIDVQSNTKFTIDGKVHHFFAAWAADLDFAKVFIDGVDDTKVNTILNDGTSLIDYARTDWAIWAATNSFNRLNGTLAHLYLRMTSHVDPGDGASLRRFLSARKKPVYLGEAGSLPVATAPAVYLSGFGSAMLTNRGLADSAFVTRAGTPTGWRLNG